MGVGGTALTAGLGGGLTGCSGDDDNNDSNNEASFEHGVASGDPLQDRVIIWTRVTPDDEDVRVSVRWEIARDDTFQEIDAAGAVVTDRNRDYTVKVDATGLSEGTPYFYRFIVRDNVSPTGRTRTLPDESVDQVKFAVVSCSNYPAGYFHVYAEIAAMQDVDVALHLGDYIYEYARGEYASEDAAALGREVDPEGEILTLDDYRLRYAQYRSDPDLQAFHGALPVIAVWDDHEVANDAWSDGAENHSDSAEGAFAARLLSALQAYAEWMPIRPPVDNDVASLYRRFRFGDLVDLLMLDTRIVGRDQQLVFPEAYLSQEGVNFDAYLSDLSDSERTLLGEDQFLWLQERLTSNSVWHVLGQQVLMGRMELPGSIVSGELSVAEFAALAQIDPSMLSQEQLALLQLPQLPYNPDAWDGYATERDAILATASAQDIDLVVLAGDTHNAWANNLLADRNDLQSAVGVEFATPSVSSPGAEAFLNLDSEEAVLQTEAGLTQLFGDLQYTNLSDRGFLTVTFTRSEVRANWTFIDSVKRADFQTLGSRNREIVVPVGARRIV